MALELVRDVSCVRLKTVDLARAGELNAMMESDPPWRER